MFKIAKTSPAKINVTVFATPTCGNIQLRTKIEKIVTSDERKSDFIRPS